MNMENTVEVKSVCGACGEVAVATIDADVKGMEALPGPTPGQWMEPDGAGFIKKRKKAKARRLRGLGAIPKKDADDDIEVKEEDHDMFLCGLDRKVYPGTVSACANCPGGCVSEKSLPTLVEIEGYTEDLFDAKVLASGYAPNDDKFIVQAEKSGEYFEVIYNGETARVEQWTLLEQNVLGEKSAEQKKLIGVDEAAEIALKVLPGTAGDVVADRCDDQDAWRVSITGEEGGDFDAFVSLEGSFLGYDEYTVEMKEAPGVEVSEVEGDPDEVDPGKLEEKPGDEEEPEVVVKSDEETPDEEDDITDALAEFKALTAED